MSTTTSIPHPEAGTDTRAPVVFLRWVAVTFVLIAALNIGLSLRFGPIRGDLARVASRLEGSPLAAELAAARLRLFSAGQLAARLDDPIAALDPVSQALLLEFVNSI